MSRRIVILGGGPAGTLAANRVNRRYGESVQIVVIDRDDRHVYQPGQLLIPFGMEEPDGIVRSRRKHLRHGIEFRLAEIDRVETAENAVHLAGGEALGYDVLVIASGASLLPGETDGMTGAGWGERVFDFYSLQSATALHDARERFDSGRLVVAVVDMPIKCPPAPLEFAFLADWYLRERDVRDRGPGLPVHPSGRELGLEPDPVPLEHPGEVRRGDRLGERAVKRRHVGDPRARTRSRRPLTGACAGRSAHTPTRRRGPARDRLRRALPGRDAGRERRPPSARRGARGQLRRARELLHRVGVSQGAVHRLQLRGRASRATTRIRTSGRCRCCRESRINHLAKLAFQPIYWHLLLPGHDIPGISAQLSMAGKQLPATE